MKSCLYLIKKQNKNIIIPGVSSSLESLKFNYLNFRPENVLNAILPGLKIDMISALLKPVKITNLKPAASKKYQKITTLGIMSRMGR